MAIVDSSPETPKSYWALQVARIWAVYMGLCQLGSLAGSLIPLLLWGGQSPLGPHPAMTILSLGRDSIGIVTAVALFAGLRRARVGLLLLLPLNTAYFLVWTILISVEGGIAGFLFGLILYVTPLVMLYWRSEAFH